MSEVRNNNNKIIIIILLLLYFIINYYLYLLLSPLIQQRGLFFMNFESIILLRRARWLGVDIVADDGLKIRPAHARYDMNGICIGTFNSRDNTGDAPTT